MSRILTMLPCEREVRRREHLEAYLCDGKTNWALIIERLTVKGLIMALPPGSDTDGAWRSRLAEEFRRMLLGHGNGLAVCIARELGPDILAGLREKRLEERRPYPF
jgi:hypothetical protein